MKVPRVYVIGLPGRYRSELLEADLRALGLAVQRCDGVLVVEDRRAEYVDDEASAVLLRRKLTLSEIGCALAHRKVYSRFLSEAAEAWCIVCEDDAEVRSFDQSAVNRLDDLFAGSVGPAIVPLYTVAGFAVTSGSVERSGAMQTVVPPTTTTAYAINRQAAAQLLVSERLSHVADWPIEASASCRFFVFPYNAFAPSGAESTIGLRSGPAESRAKSVMRRLASVLHLRWLRHRGTYLSYRAYVLHELVRGPAYRRGLERGEHVSEASMPTKLLAMLAGPPRDLPGTQARTRREVTG